jgi:hypothetical protein
MRIALFVLLLGLAGPVSTAYATDPQSVAMVSLISDPQRFDGQLIRVIAFLRLDFEGNVLYLHREDYEQAILPNGIWIALTDEQKTKAKKLSNSYVIAEGTFSSKDKGHKGMWSGSLHDVTRLDRWQSHRK